MSFTELEKKRYSRHFQLQEIGEQGQAKLKSASVLVIGAGGLGCPVLQYLAAAGVGNIGIMDFDVVEASNLQRQILFNESDIGKSKASCAADRLNTFNPHIRVTAINEKLTTLNIRSIFSEYEIIVDGTDNFATRYLINDGCVLLDKPFVFGSLYKFSGQVSVFNYLNSDGSRSATYRDLFPVPPDPGTVSDCVDSGVLGSVAGIIGTIQATEVIKLITASGNSLAGSILMINAGNLEFKKWNISPASNHEGTPNSWEELVNFDYEFFCNSVVDSSIDSEEFNEIRRNQLPVQIIDVREKWEAEETPIPGAISIPLHELASNLVQLNPLGKIVIVCAEGKRSKLAVIILRNAGFKDVKSLDQGIIDILENSQG